MFGDHLHVGLQSGGMHLLARPSGGAPDTMLVQLAEMQGLAPTALSPLSIGGDCSQGLLLSFTNIPREYASETARALRRAIGNHLAAARPGSR